MHSRSTEVKVTGGLNNVKINFIPDDIFMIFFKCFKENGPGYLANLFKPPVTPYNLRSNGLNVKVDSFIAHMRT